MLSVVSSGSVMVPFWKELLRSFSFGLLVPLSERRHRLNNDEIPAVIAGLMLYLERLLEKKDDRASAETAFQAFYRLRNDKPGRPSYPEFSWDLIEYYTFNYDEVIGSRRA